MKKHVVLFALVACIFAACKDDPKVVPDPESAYRQVEVSVVSSMLKSAATAEEDAIGKLLIFGVNDAQPEGIDTVYVESTYSGGPLTLTVPRTVKTLYAIANYSTAMEAQAETLTTLAELKDITGDFSTAPQSPYLMGGMGTVNDKAATIELVRAVAKVVIAPKNGLVIETVTVKNTPTLGYAFSRNPLTVPSAAVTDYAPVTTAAPVLYVAENVATNPTKFQIIGRKDGNIPVDYTIELTKGGTNAYINILRNTAYTVSVTPITEDQCEIDITIPEWKDEETDEHTMPD
jgi:hypothetical protein